METDWDKVELDYRAGILSIGTICSVHDITRQRLNDKVANGGWSRDLMSQVRVEVNERMYMDRRNESAAQDHVAIAAQVIIDTVYAHRRDIAHLRGTISRTLNQINEILATGSLLDQHVDEDSVDKSLLIIRSMQGSLLFGKTQGVVSALDTLASAYQRVITMERQAFGLDSIGSVTAESEPGQAPIATVQVYLPHNHRDPVA